MLRKLIREEIPDGTRIRKTHGDDQMKLINLCQIEYIFISGGKHGYRFKFFEFVSLTNFLGYAIGDCTSKNVNNANVFFVLSNVVF